eukprot:TRINITY_DN43445_c0_g1_i1.p1 TRINITY_DN43445_c0_g1~~TRINITY_DN43445_c0_g1_i1.p1  ORF type:complete len:959 (+),score=140.06 TRINITY_DN43445_c0_g1_i1:65-2941(+)
MQRLLGWDQKQPANDLHPFGTPLLQSINDMPLDRDFPVLFASPPTRKAFVSQSDVSLGDSDAPDFAQIDAVTTHTKMATSTQVLRSAGMMELHTSRSRASTTDSLELAAPPHSRGCPWLVQLGVALFSAFMCTTDTVSMGAVLFPQASPALKAQGIRMCLLSTAVANLVLAYISDVPHNVGALVDTVVPVLAVFFATMQEEATIATALVAIPVLTVLTGFAMYGAGRLGCGGIVRACPYAVFGGFIAGTGAQLLQLGINMMLPGFTSFLEPQSWSNLLTMEGLIMCGPGMVAAIFTFVVPRYVPHVDSFLLPLNVISLTAMFYVVLLWTGTPLDDARRLGFLFAEPIPDKLDFFQVWTAFKFEDVKWIYIISPEFVSAFLQIFALTFLATVKNIYGTSEFTKAHTDIDKEICASGVVNVACGLMGGCPSGTVMSFSVAAHSLGARGKVFSWLLAMISVALFIFGDYVVAVLPKMVPACVVIWIGLVLMIYYLWEPFGKMSSGSYAIIVVMVFIDLSLGCSLMMITGLFLAFLNTINSMMALPLFRLTYTLSSVRSDVIRPVNENNVLAQHGDGSQVVQLEAGLLTYANAFKVLDLVQDSGIKLEYLIIDWTLVKDVCDSAANTIQEMMQVAENKGFYVIFAAANPHVEKTLLQFGIGLDHSVVHMGPKKAAVATAQLKPSQTSFVCRDYDDGSCAVDAMVQAVEFVEERLLQCNCRYPVCTRRDHNSSSMPPPLQQSWKMLMNTGFDAASPTLPVIADMDWWLSRWHSHAYRLEKLKALADALEEHTFGCDEMIYLFQPQSMLNLDKSISLSASVAGSISQTPPLIWLLEGHVEHQWDDQSADGHDLFTSARVSSRLTANKRLEKAVLDKARAGECLGPLRTVASFCGAMGHIGRIVSKREGTRVALLHRNSYEQLLHESPDAVDLLNVYLTKKQFVDFARLEQTLAPASWRRQQSPY